MSSEKFQNVVLYYPNSWRRNIGDLMPAEDKKFNWFICSKRYLDPESNVFVAEVARGTLFYEEDTGKTLVIPLKEGEDEGIKLLILSNPPKKGDYEVIKRYKYGGYAKMHNCDISDKAQDECIVCKEVSFYFREGILVLSTKEKFCPIINFSKKNNISIRKVYPEFPTAEQISAALQNHKCHVVCQILYDYIREYLARL